MAPICQRHRIRRLALFGSHLKGTARPDSDVDLLVDFLPDAQPTYFDLADIEIELSSPFDGRKLDVRTPAELSRYFREQVQRASEDLYVAA